jgi:diguanylate cyclase (GGDEF)-like protein
LGARPVFVDIEPDTFNIDPAKIEEALSNGKNRNVRALMPVHFAGQACDMDRICAIARRYKSPASVIYFDLNGFKTVNDRYGHAAGDAVLIAVAERLLGAVREEDVVGRIGGDEFAVLLQRADAAAAGQKAEHLHQAITHAPIAFRGRSMEIGITYGVREIAAADSAEQAMAEADANMYLRKPGRTR